MTNREKALEIFKEHVEKLGYEPKFSEIANALGISRQAVTQYFHTDPEPYIKIFPPIIKYLK